MSLNLKNYIYKKFIYNLPTKGGRNRLGRITISNRGSSCALKRKFLTVDLQCSLLNLSYILLQVRPSPRRSAFVGLILYKNGLFSYILVSKTASVGSIWSFEYLRVYKIGDYLKLSLIPEGFSIYNIELSLGSGGKVARAGGTSVKIINRFPNKHNKILLKFRSGEEYLVNGNCGANIGVSSNSNNWLRKFENAGHKKLFSKRSSVRGTAMNPVDHAHGGNTTGESLA